VASQAWQLTATYLKWPVSGTHTIISALMGFTLVENGGEGVNVGNPNIFNGSGVFKVIYGLLVSPTLTFFLAFGFYYFVYKTIVKSDPRSLVSRITISSTVFLTFLAIGFTAASMPAMPIPEGFGRKPFGLLIGALLGFFAAAVFMLGVLPILLKAKEDQVIKLDRQLSRQLSRTLSISDKAEERQRHLSSASQKRLSRPLSVDDSERQEELLKEESFKKVQLKEEQVMEVEEEDDESEEVMRVFRPLQLLTACFGALSHGSNDVGNCIGPLVTVWYIYRQPVGYSTDQPLYGILLWGGIGISLGMVCCGSRVIETMGSKISKMTPSLGFTVVLTASVVVMVCSMAGIPTSTTHCQVMGVVGAGIARGWVDTGSLKGGFNTIDFSLMRNIALSWIATIPFAMALSALVYAVADVILIG